MSSGWAAVIASCATLIVTVGLYFASRKPKKLIFGVRSDQHLVAPSPQHVGELAVLHNERRLATPRAVAIWVQNAGRVELRAEDVTTPLRVTVADGDHLVSGQAVRRNRDTGAESNVEIAELTDTTVTVVPVDLNEGDRIELSLLVDGNAGTPSVDGHFAGFRFRPGIIAERPPGRLSRFDVVWRVATLVLTSALIVLSVVLAVKTHNEARTTARAADLEKQMSGLIGQIGFMPQVEGKPLDQAVRAIYTSGIRLSGVDYARSNKPANTVVTQYPGPRTVVDKTHDTAQLTISIGPTG